MSYPHTRLERGHEACPSGHVQPLNAPIIVGSPADKEPALGGGHGCRDGKGLLGRVIWVEGEGVVDCLLAVTSCHMVEA